MRPDWGVGAALVLFVLAGLGAVNAKRTRQLCTSLFLAGCGGTIAALTASSRGAGWALSMVSLLLVLGFVLTLKPTIHGSFKDTISSDQGIDEPEGESPNGGLTLP